MDWTFQLTQHQTDALLDDLAPRLRVHAAAHYGPLRVAASLPVYQLAVASVLQRGDARLGDPEVAFFTNRVQHHVTSAAADHIVAAMTEGVARTGEIRHVRAVFQSHLNAKIATALHALSRDESVCGIRLLVVPDFYITVLWLHGDREDDIYVIDGPHRSRLKPQTRYLERDFIAALRDVSERHGSDVSS